MDMKESLLLGLQYALEVKHLNEGKPASPDKPVIITSFGYIVGDILSINNQNKPEIKAELSVMEMIDTNIGRFIKDNKLNIEAAPYITIINAEIHQFNQSPPAKMKLINLFTDQIIGFSYGQTSCDNV